MATHAAMLGMAMLAFRAGTDRRGDLSTAVARNHVPLMWLIQAAGPDEEAIKAAAQWRFRPGMRRGEPVPVLVTLEIAFSLR